MIQSLLLTEKQRATRFWAPVLLTAALLSVPMSSTAKSIFLSMAVALIVFTPSYYNYLVATLSERWCQAALFLFGIALVGCLWSPASTHEKMLVLEKYSKLLYLPVLVAGFREERTRQFAMHGFLAAMFLTCLISILKFSGLLHYQGMDPNPGHIFHNHIMTGYMMTFAAYLAATLSVQKSGAMRLAYGFLAILFSYQVLFVNFGRTGFVLFILLLMMFLMQILTWRNALIAALLASSLLVTAYHQNTEIRERIQLGVSEWHNYQADHDKDTAIGYRLQFHDYAKSLFLRHPWLGNGTASFTHKFAEEKPVPSWNRRLLEPHSMYWLVAAEFGIVGLIGLGFFFASLILAALKLNKMRAIALGVLIPFFAGNCTDSLLFYSGTGYFFILFMALCLGNNKRAKLTNIGNVPKVFL